MNDITLREILNLSMNPSKYFYLENFMPEQTAIAELKNSYRVIRECLSRVSEERSLVSYMKGKWDLKTLLLHICDTERIFQYRALCLARDKMVTIQPFDENVYALNSQAENRDFSLILEEFNSIHQSGLILFKSFNHSQWTSTGTFMNQPVNPGILAFNIAGHRVHHVRVIKERYFAHQSGDF